MGRSNFEGNPSKNNCFPLPLLWFPLALLSKLKETNALLSLKNSSLKFESRLDDAYVQEKVYMLWSRRPVIFYININTDMKSLF